jgi:2-desacetyl-2-hydroxyethyl bacteriochlorophyllide A dehydrogenase
LIRQAVWFVEPGRIEVKEEELGEPEAGQVLVSTKISAISSGTELLLLHGMVSEDLALDTSIAGLTEQARFPFKYGYCSVGVVTGLGEGVAECWLGKRVFSFQPHESAYLAAPEQLIEIPDGIAWEDAVFLPNMETALNLVMDAAPLVGETAVVFGLGIVGLLATAILSQFPLALLVGIDPIAMRRAKAREVGAAVCIDPFQSGGFEWTCQQAEKAGSQGGVDLVIECSGSPHALDQAVALTGFEGRVVVGSWYGKRPVQLNLGGRFHRSRIQLISSQVSTLAGKLSGRWTKQRRFGVVWELIRKLRPGRWITHRYAIRQAVEAYQLLEEGKDGTLQVILQY